MAFSTLWSAPVSKLVVAGCSMMMILIPVTYLLCVHQDHCPIFLPTISDTWVYPPGNYLSRWFVGNLCDLFAVFQLVIYWDNKSYSQTNTRTRGCSCSFETLLAISWFGIFCLSWVGAICDSSSAESCRGNNSIHTTCAVTFFVLYDFYMLADNYKNPDRTTCTRWFAAIAHTVLLGRFVVPASLIGSDTALAVVEWTDVAMIVYWTINYPLSISLTSVMQWGGIYGNKDDVEADATVLSYINAPTIMRWINGCFVLVFAGCYIAGVAKGTLPTDRVPFISDMWVYPPGNWFSRWGVVQATHWAYPLMAFLCYCNTSSTTTFSLSNKALLGIAELGLFFLSIVGVCNESENIVIHSISAIIFFVSFDIYMLVTALNATFKLTEAERAETSPIRRVALLLLTVIAIVAQFLRIYQDGGEFLVSIAAILEWTNAAALVVFLNVDVYTRSNLPNCFSALFESSEATTARQQAETRENLRIKLIEGAI